jgi:hypothetical protein
MARDMGLGRLGDANIVFKRKYRWTFIVQTNCEPYLVQEHVVKLAARPNLTIEETEINFLHGKFWIPGKGTWETITVTYYDIANDNTLGALYAWLASIYDFTDPVRLYQSSRRGDGLIGGTRGYSGLATLSLYDGCGQTIETWELADVWPQAINFGELDYSSSEEVTIELTLRYSQVKYTPFCSPQFKPCCDGCDPSTQSQVVTGGNPSFLPSITGVT